MFGHALKKLFFRLFYSDHFFPTFLFDHFLVVVVAGFYCWKVNLPFSIIVYATTESIFLSNAIWKSSQFIFHSTVFLSVSFSFFLPFWQQNSIFSIEKKLCETERQREADRTRTMMKKKSFSLFISSQQCSIVWVSMFYEAMRWLELWTVMEQTIIAILRVLKREETDFVKKSMGNEERQWIKTKSFDSKIGNLYSLHICANALLTGRIFSLSLSQTLLHTMYIEYFFYYCRRFLTIFS